MEYTITEEKELTRKFSVQVPESDLNEKIESKINDYVRQAQLPGFRKGKAPAGMIKARFAKDIRTDVMEELMPSWIGTIVEENEHRLASEPHLHHLELGGMGEGITFTIHYEVHPTVELEGYKGLELEIPKIEANDAMLDDYLRRRRKEAAALDPVEGRAAERGDVLVINLDGGPLEPKEGEEPDKHENVTLSANEVEGDDGPFYTGAMGMEKGESKTIEHTFPEDYPDETRRGRAFKYDLTLTDLRTETLPELDDEFAKDLEFESLEAMKADGRVKLEKFAKDQKVRMREDLTLAKLKTLCPLTIPKAIVEKEAKARLERFAYSLQQQGIPLDGDHMDWGDAFNARREEAESALHAMYLLGHIAEKENLKLEESDWQNAMEREAEQTGHPVEELEKHFADPQFREQRNEGILRQKALAWVLESAKITEVDPEDAKDAPDAEVDAATKKE